MSSQAEQEVQAVAGQNWREILLYLYENEIVIDTHGQEGWISPNADVVEETELDPEQVIAELQYLDDEGLVDCTYLEVDDESETFVAYRLTADGFQIAQERTEAAREREQAETQIGINRQLFHATLVLAVTGFMQATASVVAIKGSFREVLLGGFLFLLLLLLAIMIGGTFGGKMWSTFQQSRLS